MAKDLILLRYWRAIGWLMILFVVVMSLIPPPQLNLAEGSDKWMHLLAYLGLMLWFCQWTPRAHRWRLFFAFILLGATIEYLQGLTTYRTAEWMDLVADGLGLILGWLLSLSWLGDVLRRLERSFKG